jgi:hypothetical protein
MTREQRIEAVLDRFGKYIVQQARANLTRKNKNVSKDLYNSIKLGSLMHRKQVLHSPLRFLCCPMVTSKTKV